VFNLYSRVLRVSVKKKVDGIGIVDMNRDDTDNEAFLEATVAALNLIRQLDARRYANLIRHVHFIVNGELDSGGRYQYHTRSIELDFPKYRVYPDADDYGWYLARYAAVVIHEATHARLCALSFPYTTRTRVQIERICVAEQRRFLAKWSGGRFELSELRQEFDERQWHGYWYGGAWRRVRDLLKRMRRSPGTYARGARHIR
jgi:hypothetical protein